MVSRICNPLAFPLFKSKHYCTRIKHYRCPCNSSSHSMACTNYGINSSNASTHISEGCSGAVERILAKVDGVTNVETNVDAKSVIVTATDGVTAEELVEKLSKWSAASGKYVKIA